MSVAPKTHEKWDARVSYPITREVHPHVHNTAYYLKCMVGGVLSCGLTHTAVVPLDIVKCKMQVFPEKYKGLIQGFKTVYREEGIGGLRIGWLPTLMGYSAQGLFKFGLYEFFKDFYGNLAGEENAYAYKKWLWLAGSASAEFFADIALCPMEMVKVKIQISKPGTFPTTFLPAYQYMKQNSAETRFPFGSVKPLWGRQIPYTMAKFFFFEYIVTLFYTHVFTQPKNTYSKSTQLSVTFASGYIAGVVCAIVSQAPDNLVSQMGKPENKGKGFGQIASEQGAKRLFTKGLGTRIIMIGTLTGLQWWIYDTFKTAMGMGTTGGSVAKK
jgi:solute carrier family 25 phosphate transporter 3